MTIAVAMPATTTAPSGPDRTISSILASSVSGDDGASRETIMVSSCSLQWRGAERIGLACGNRGSVVAPGNADVGHNGGNLIIRKRLCEGGLSMRHRIAGRPGGVAAIKNHPHRVHGRGHLD